MYTHMSCFFSFIFKLYWYFVKSISIVNSNHPPDQLQFPDFISFHPFLVTSLFCILLSLHSTLQSPCSGYASPDILLYSTLSSKGTFLFIPFCEQCFCIYFLLHFVHMLFCTCSNSGSCSLTFVFKLINLTIQSNLIILLTSISVTLYQLPQPLSLTICLNSSSDPFPISGTWNLCSEILGQLCIHQGGTTHKLNPSPYL